MPILEHDWKLVDLLIYLISDVDGVFTHGPPLPVNYFNNLFEKSRYKKIAEEVKENEERIDTYKDGKYFGAIAKCLFKAGLTLEDHLEACEVAGEETEITPYAHEAIKSLYDIPPFIGLGFNSASFTDSLNFFCKDKRLQVSLIKGSWLEFHNNKFTGRYFFNYGSNKMKSGREMLTQVGCVTDLVINKSKLDVITLSDTRDADKYFREFVGLSGISIWMDKSIRRGVQAYPQSVLEINIPESMDDMRIFVYPIKHLYRAKVISILTSPEELNTTSESARELIALGKECLRVSDEKLFDIKLQKFIGLTQKTLALLSKFDFPRYSTGIDFKYIELLSQSDMKKRKEIISEILDLYIQNFPESLIIG